MRRCHHRRASCLQTETKLVCKGFINGLSPGEAWKGEREAGEATRGGLASRSCGALSTANYAPECVPTPGKGLAFHPREVPDTSMSLPVKAGQLQCRHSPWRGVDAGLQEHKNTDAGRRGHRQGKGIQGDLGGVPVGSAPHGDSPSPILGTPSFHLIIS